MTRVIVTRVRHAIHARSVNRSIGRITYRSPGSASGGWRWLWHLSPRRRAYAGGVYTRTIATCGARGEHAQYVTVSGGRTSFCVMSIAPRDGV
jgi:hypothetical protein